MSLRVKVLNPLATLPTLAHPGEDLGYDVYALRQQGQPMNADGTPMVYTPPVPGKPFPMTFDGRTVKPIRLEAGRPQTIETGIAVHFIRDHEIVYEFEDSTKQKSGDKLKQVAKTKKYGLLVRDRGSVASRGIFVTAGVIDAGYRGELKIVLNLSTGSYQDIWPGDKIAQIIPVEVLADTVEAVDTLEESERKEDGFGSTGK